MNRSIASLSSSSAEPEQRPRRTLETRIAGTTYDNPDGVNRQSLLRRCRPGQRLELRRDPQNPYDANAVKVCVEGGAQLGFIPRELAARLSPALDRGTPLEATLKHVTGGGEGFHLGCVICISERTPTSGR